MENKMTYGLLKKVAPVLGVSSDNLSGIINGHRNISKNTALRFAKSGKKIGLKLSGADWLFDLEKVKKSLAALEVK